jgi:hypothetical protein
MPQCQGARRRDRQRMLVRHHAVAPRRPQEGDLRALEEGAYLALGARPGPSLADDDRLVRGIRAVFWRGMAYDIVLAPVREWRLADSARQGRSAIVGRSLHAANCA